MTEEKDLIRKIPASIDAEKMLLGSIIINQEQLYKVNEFLLAEHFFESLHQKIYQAFLTMLDKNLSISAVTLQTMLERDEALVELGGASYIDSLQRSAISVINATDYARVIYDLAMKRSLINLGENMVNDAYNPSFERDAKEQIEQAESNLYELASKGVSERSFTKISDSVSSSLAVIDRAIKNSDKIIGISTGLKDLDQKLAGFHNSDLIVLAGRPAMGKTAFAINFFLNSYYALKERNQGQGKVPAIAFFSLEMSSEQLTTRLFSMLAKIDSSKIRNGMINETDYSKLREVASKISEMPVFIDDTPALSISALRTKARRLKRQHNLGIIFVDYLQLIRGARKRENRVLEISEITQSLKAIAKELNVPVVALSQLSRAVEQRDDKRPILSDLRESGSIEQDADVVIFIHREEYYMSNKEPPLGDPKHDEWKEKANEVHNIAELIIAKHRNGPVGVVKVFYDTSHFYITNLSKSRG